jgi:hypothetical protein
VTPLVERVLPAVNLLPVRLREQVYRIASGSEAAPPGELHAVSAELVARWMVGRYPRREYPAAIVGSSSGALTHLAVALGVPFLPQTFLLPVAQPQVAPDDPRDDLAAGAGPGRLLLDANPEVALHHMHDPNQDRSSLARMTYFRLKRRRLGAAFTGFLADTLPRGATLLVADCRACTRGTSAASAGSTARSPGCPAAPRPRRSPSRSWTSSSPDGARSRSPGTEPRM